jgi:hypothetical protein
MGLTIHYQLRSTAKSAERARELVEKMRQLALDLPFERVDDEVRHLGPEAAKALTKAVRCCIELITSWRGDRGALRRYLKRHCWRVAWPD